MAIGWAGSSDRSPAGWPSQHREELFLVVRNADNTGPALHRSCIAGTVMITEFGTLIGRDHEGLTSALRLIVGPVSEEAQLLALLESVRVGFAAHVEAECVVLHSMLEDVQPAPLLYFLVAQVVAAHLAQESALASLVAVRPGTAAWRERAKYLQRLIERHADHEAACLHPALPDHIPITACRNLAGSYDRERLRALAMLRLASSSDLFRATSRTG